MYSYCTQIDMMGDSVKQYKLWQVFFGDYDAVFFDMDWINGSIHSGAGSRTVEKVFDDWRTLPPPPSRRNHNSASRSTGRSHR